MFFFVLFCFSWCDSHAGPRSRGHGLSRSRRGGRGFVSGYDADQEIDSLELRGGGRHIVLIVHGPDLGEIDGIVIGREIRNVFTIENDMIIRIEDHLRHDEALNAASLT